MGGVTTYVKIHSMRSINFLLDKTYILTVSIRLFTKIIFILAIDFPYLLHRDAEKGLVWGRIL